jgi:hypothetical protein
VSPAGLALAFGGGVISFLSPCMLPLGLAGRDLRFHPMPRRYGTGLG